MQENFVRPGGNDEAAGYRKNTDLNAGTVIQGTESIEEVGTRIYEEMLRVASGKLTKAEIMKQHDFGQWRIGHTF